MWIKNFILLFLLAAFSVNYGFAQFQVPVYQGYVTDYAEILSMQQRVWLEQKIQFIQDSVGVQIAVLFVDTVGDDDIAFAATQVGQTWGIGYRNSDNGLLVLVAVEDRERFVAVGYGLEGMIPDIIAKRVSDRYFPDAFRAGEYTRGIELFLDDVVQYIDGDEWVRTQYDDNNSGVWFFAVFLSLIFLFILWFGSQSSRQKLTKTWLRSLAVLLLWLWSGFAIALLYVSFFALFVIMPRMGMLGWSWYRPWWGWFGGGGFWWWGGGWFGGFGGGGFWWWGARGRR
jgi:uncharacterized protein